MSFHCLHFCFGKLPLLAGNSLIPLGYSLKGCYRPNPDRHRKNARKSAIELLRPIHLADLRMLPAQQLEIYTCDSGNR